MNPLQFRGHHQPPSHHQGLIGEACLLLFLGRPRYSLRIVVSLSPRNGNPAGPVPGRAGVHADPDKHPGEGIEVASPSFQRGWSVTCSPRLAFSRSR